MRVSLHVLLVLAVLPVSLPARGDDSSSATSELKAGYALKQAGHCAEAIPHFLASYRADPKPKALLNLADCEGQVGELVAARGHAAQGHDLAQQQNDAELVGVALDQLAAIDKRLPQLTIRLAPGAPMGSMALRDGSLLSGASLGAPVPLDPGSHRIVVTAPRHAQREFDVTLTEGARVDLEVQPGEPVAVGAGRDEPNRPEDSGLQARQILTYGAIGLGVAGIVVGIATGIAAGSKHGALESECTGSSCPPSAQNDLDGFHSLKTWSTVGYGIGIAGVAGGAALWLTAPRAHSDAPRARVWLGPISAGVRGEF